MSVKIIRKELQITGLIQGAGLRPFIFNLAQDLKLKGWVKNTDTGLSIEVEGLPDAIACFLDRIQQSPPSHSYIESLLIIEHKYYGYVNFELRTSATQGEKSLFILPDIAMCAECKKEIADPANRRYQYAFTSCSQCGPRYSIINALPYDRVRTTMQDFPMCANCQHEYDDPADRRFHAQTIACADCGPSVQLTDKSGQFIESDVAAIKQAAEALKQGAIIAIKGIGGFQLLANANCKTSVARLRDKKYRPEKPFALMCKDMPQVRSIATLGAQETQMLQSAAAPIVLLNKKQAGFMLAENIAPNNTRIGIMLACTPLHHLLLSYLSTPVVATSGNISNEPICIVNQQALEQLGQIADVFLIHNRSILRPIDDSVVQAVHGSEMLIRAARGYAPITIKLPKFKANMLALGGHLKNTFALASEGYTLISQHNGDLESLATVQGFKQNITDLSTLVQHQTDLLVQDQHSDYASSQYGDELSQTPCVRVQHHHAHLLSCVAEHGITEPLLAVVWDGAGLGDDGSLWGGEFFTLENKVITRIASLREFSLPGGSVAIKEPRRTALGVLWEFMGDSLFARTDLAAIQTFTEYEHSLLNQVLKKQLNAPRFSSIGRLFDCVASLLDLCQISTYEGQAASRLEQCINGCQLSDSYPLLWHEQNDLIRLDWQPLLENIMQDLAEGTEKSVIACKFHNTLVESIVDRVHGSGLKTVVLSGGSFQNSYLTEAIIKRLMAINVKVFWQQKVPCNDGGLALGQLLAVIQQQEFKTCV